MEAATECSKPEQDRSLQPPVAKTNREREVGHFDNAGKVPRGRQTRVGGLERSNGTGEVHRTAEAKASE